jgi:membrane-bound lytic murein transglycosylase
MKKLSMAIAMLFACTYAISQAVPVSTMIEKENRNAVMIVINQPVKITTEALQQKLQRAGLDEKVKKGSASYKGVTLSEISKEKIDVYTKVEEAPNNTSAVYMAVSRGYNNFTNSGADSAITQNTIAFLNSFVKDADNHFADVNITGQMGDVSKSEKDYQKLLDEQRSLEKQKSAIDTRLGVIQVELANLKTDTDKKKLSVEDSKNKRANNNK